MKLKDLLKGNKEKDELNKKIELIRSSDLFDENWYYDVNPDVLVAHKDAARHYFISGWKEGRNPSDKFSNDAYLEEHPECDICPLYDYEQKKQDDAYREKIKNMSNYDLLAQSTYFDKDYYLKHCPNLRKRGKDPIKHYLKYGWKMGLNPSAKFNTNFYLERNQGVKKRNINPLVHYIKYGFYEKRLPKEKNNLKNWLNNILNRKYKNKSLDYILVAKSKYFDASWYLNEYPEVAKAGIDPVEHYLNIGWKEGKNPSPLFDGNDYLERYAGVQKTGRCPLLHFEKYGKKEHRVVKSIIKNNYSMSVWKAVHFEYLRLKGKLLYLIKFKKNKNAKILVCLHLFYMEAWDVIKKYLKNLEDYNYDLIVTYIDGFYDVETLQKIKEFKPNAQLYECLNRGFDIGPFVDVISKVDLNRYDIVYKLQSKGTHRESIFIYNQIFKTKDWFFNLFDGILGGCSVHFVIDFLMNKKNVGLVASENLIIKDPKHKNFFTHEFAKQYKIKIPEEYRYVAGTCFAMKARVLKFLQKKKITIENFDEVKRGEFSFAHAMERIVCAMVEKKGYEYKGIPVYHHIYKKELSEREKTSSIRLLDDDRFIIDYDFFYKALEGRKIFSYELAKLKIKDINRRWVDGKIYSIKETSAYAYLQGDVKRYEEYCEINAQNSKFNMNKERFDRLSNSVRRSFNFKMMPVLDGANNIIQDGQHRLAILLDKYGEDYEVQCLKVYYNERIKEIPIKFSKKAIEIVYTCQKDTMKKLAVFSSFSVDGKISERLVYYLKELKKVCDGIIFIADNPLIPTEFDKIKDLVVHAEASRHGEYDFGSYKRGYLYALNNHLLDNVEELIFCNDSCYGPIYPFKTMFDTMNQKHVDFWGICANDDFRYHLQSYFIVFNNCVFNSNVFYEFINSVKKEDDRRSVILNYETKLTKLLMQEGFTCDSYIPFVPNDEKYPYKYRHNLTYFPIYLMKLGCPLIKVKIINKTLPNFDGDRETFEYIRNTNQDIAEIITKQKKLQSSLKWFGKH